MTGIIVLFGKSQETTAIKQLLAKRGYEVTAGVTLGGQALANADMLEGGIIVCGYRYADMLYSELYRQLPEGFDMLLIAGSSLIEEGVEEDVVTLPMPLKVTDLFSTMDMMLSTMERRRRKERFKKAGRNDTDRHLIDEAKSVLMGRNHMSETEAHRYLQKSSMEGGRGMTETARMVLSLMG